LEEFAELVIARFGVERDRDLAVVVTNRRRTRLEERYAEARRGGGIRQRPVEGRDFFLAGQPILQRVEPRLELHHFTAILRQVGDDRAVPLDFALQRGQLAAQLRDLFLGRCRSRKYPAAAMMMSPA